MITMNRVLLFSFQMAIFFSIFVRNANTKIPSFGIQLDLDEANKKEPIPFKSASFSFIQPNEEIKKQRIPLKSVPTSVSQPDKESQKEPEFLKPVPTPVTELNKDPQKTPVPANTTSASDTQPKEEPLPLKPVSASVPSTKLNKKSKKEKKVRESEIVKTNPEETMYCITTIECVADDSEPEPEPEELQCVLVEDEEYYENVANARRKTIDYLNKLLKLVDDAQKKEELQKKLADIQYAA